jgi:trans-aconitate 2-methyltransferase
VLRDGGRLEAQCGGARNLAKVHARANALREQEQFRGYFITWNDPWLFATAAETEARLRRAGFVEPRCWIEPAPTTLPDAEQFRAFIQNVVMRPYLLPLPNDLQDRFLDAMVADAAKDGPPFTLDYWRLNISAIAN